MHKIFLALAVLVLASKPAHAQFAITEAMSSASTNLGPASVVQGPDFWELTNFGTNALDLTGYIFNDADATRSGDANTTTLTGVTIGPGESILLVQSGTTVTNRDDFLNWWGAANLATNVQVLFYSGNGLSSAGDSLVLWAPTAVSDDDMVDRVDFGEAARGRSFTYHPTNGSFGAFSTNGFGGAFKAVTSDDEASPCKTTGPVPLAITQQPTPASQAVPASQSATFMVAARGLPHPRFQWRFKGVPIDGAIRSSLTISNAQLSDAGQYSVVVSNGLQTIVSSNATLTVTTTPIPPGFSTVPKDLDTFYNQMVRLSAEASGSPTPEYQWRKDGVVMPGETGSQLMFYGVQSGDATTYTVVVSSSAGTNQASAKLTVGPKPRLLITEVHSTGSTGHADWWELTSFDNRPINLNGWRWDDNSHSLAPGNAVAFSNDIIIHPGESVVFVEGHSASQFRSWWGTNLPADLQLVTYTGGQLGLSSSADEVNLWNAASLPGNELTERICGVNFGACPVGCSFVYDPENPPVAGIMSTLSTNTVKGMTANAVFAAADGGNFASPGYVTSPVYFSAMPDGGKHVALTWNSVGNRSYTVEYKTNLAATAWSVLDSVTAAGATTTVTDSAAGAQRFYRVITMIPFVAQP